MNHRTIPITRVMLDTEGTSVSVRRAIQAGVTHVGQLFIRNDNWVLAAPEGRDDIAAVAMDLWDWVSAPLLNPPRRIRKESDA